jgi:hypothetical protein
MFLFGCKFFKHCLKARVACLSDRHIWTDKKVSLGFVSRSKAHVAQYNGPLLTRLKYIQANNFSDKQLLRSAARLGARAARWYIFRPKIGIWVNFGRSCNGRC